MSNNYWQSQNNQNGSAESGVPPRKSGLLSNYGSQGKPAVSSPLPPANNPATQGPPPSSPLPPPAPYRGNQPVPGPQGAQPPARQLPPPQQQQHWNGPAFMARPAQMVQRLSNKMAAMRRPGPDVDPNPLVRYRGPQPPAAPTTRPVPTRPTPWRRSRVQRIAHLKRRRRERFLAGPGGNRVKVTIFSSIAALLLVLISSSIGYAYNFYQGEAPKINGLANSQIPQTTRIYDRHGTLLYTLYANTQWGLGGRSTPVSYNDLPELLQNAQIAAEDPTFWTNNGVDPQGVLRAFTEYFAHSGQIAGGGSTMTQQLIKNLSKDSQDTFQRKASEAALAISLTQQYSKKKIMEMYFNDTPYGAQESGVEAAAEDYFGLKPVCNMQHQCTPAIQFLDRDLSNCKTTKPQIDETTCAVDPILGLARAAMLAGIPQNPTSFDPSTSSYNLNNLLTNRLPYVLDQMVADGMQIDLGLGDKNDFKGPITKDIETQVEAKAATIKIVGFHQTMLAPHFVNWVIGTLSNELGNYQNIDPKTGISSTGYQLLLTSGLNVYTTLDLNLEQFVEKDIKHNLRDQVYQEFLGTYGPLNTVYNVNDSAAVVMDAKTGEILAMDGSADYNDSKANDPQRYNQVAGQYNAATSYLQPGSTFKPIVYATAFEEGWYPGIRLIDNKNTFPNTNPPYTPSDYLHSYHPNLYEDVRLALANSYNIPAIKALMYAGQNNVANTARRMGIAAIDRDLRVIWNGALPGPSFALGTAGIPLYQMVNAYQTFADDGMHIPYHNILDIWDNYGHNLAHYDPTHPNASRVFSEQINFLITNMLTDNYARRYEFTGIDTLTMQDWNNQPVAAKTGTTDGFKDNLTLGYTTNLVVGVWSGNANAESMNNVIGVTGAGDIWHDIIEYASGRPLLGMHTDLNLPPGTFPQPSGVVQASVNTVNGLAGTGTTDWMIDGEQPQQSGLPVCPNNNGDNGNNGNNNGNAIPSDNCTGNGNNNNGNGNGNGNNGNNNGNGNSTIYPPLDNGNDSPSGW